MRFHDTPTMIGHTCHFTHRIQEGAIVRSKWAPNIVFLLPPYSNRLSRSIRKEKREVDFVVTLNRRVYSLNGWKASANASAVYHVNHCFRIVIDYFKQYSSRTPRHAKSLLPVA